ncbi:lanthionine synthetase C family protein [Undibacterium sp. TJN19]|uniref:lanthionine synthetase C family protein n=1 Tax=Undibacterium sp. TJN19 TaxID=3413055 RepID=UPI003BF09BC5
MINYDPIPQLHSLDDVLSKIDRYLRDAIQLKSANISLASGLSGVAFFYSALSMRPNFESADQYLQLLIDQIYTNVSEIEFVDFRFFSGLPGIAFSMEILAHLQNPENVENCSINDDIDDVIFNAVKHTSKIEHFDLISGLVGIGVYALGRTNRVARERIFNLVFDSLMKVSIKTEFGLCWRTEPKYQGYESRNLNPPKGNFNLGLAHGVPGVIALFARAILNGFQSSQLKDSLSDTTNWLLANERFGTESSFSVLSGVTYDARSAWCYGDPGVSIAVILSGIALQNDGIIDRGLAIGLRAAKRLGPSAGVNDHGICHGSSGLVLIFDQLYRISGDEQFRFAADVWRQRIMNAAVSRLDINNFATYLGDGTTSHQIGMLTGISGIGLTLLSNPDEKIADWFNCLLIS